MGPGSDFASLAAESAAASFASPRLASGGCPWMELCRRNPHEPASGIVKADPGNSIDEAGLADAEVGSA